MPCPYGNSRGFGKNATLQVIAIETGMEATVLRARQNGRRGLRYANRTKRREESRRGKLESLRHK